MERSRSSSASCCSLERPPLYANYKELLLLLLDKIYDEGHGDLALRHQRGSIERVQRGAEGVHVSLQAVQEELGGVVRQFEATAQGPLLQGRDLLHIAQGLQLIHRTPGQPGCQVRQQPLDAGRRTA